MQKKDKIALLDVDGVLLRMWEKMFVEYNKYLGEKSNKKVTLGEFVDVIRDFEVNPKPYYEFGIKFMRSEAFETLNPKKGMVELVKTLKKEGWDLAIITASSPDGDIKNRRLKNINNVFGDIFVGIHCVGSKDKKSVIQEYASKYKTSMFCDDTPSNVAQSVDVVTFPIWRSNHPLSNNKGELDMKKVFVAKEPSDILDIVGVNPKDKNKGVNIPLQVANLRRSR